MLDMAPSAQLTAVLSRLDKALASGDIEAALALFQDDCYWRDLVTFTWNIRTMEGKDAIRGMLQAQLESVKPSGWMLAEGEDAAEDEGVVSGWISLRDRRGARLRLYPPEGWTDLDPAHLDHRAEGP